MGLKERFVEWLECMECRVYKGSLSDFFEEVLPDNGVVVSAELVDSVEAFCGEGNQKLSKVLENAMIIPNIAKFLPEFKFKIALCLPCEGRAVVELCKRNQLDRSNFILLGLYSPCSRSDYCTVRFSDFDIFVLEWIKGENEVVVFVKGDNRSNIVEKVRDVTERGDVSNILNCWNGLEKIEKAEKFLDSCNISITAFLDRCIKCMGCVFECPICVCEEFCFVKEAGRTATLPPPPQFLLFRMLHVADSCVNCGECDTACCANMPLSLIFQKVQRKYWKETGFIPGVDYEFSPRMR